MNFWVELEQYFWPKTLDNSDEQVSFVRTPDSACEPNSSSTKSSPQNHFSWCTTHLQAFQKRDLKEFEIQFYLSFVTQEFKAYNVGSLKVIKYFTSFFSLSATLLQNCAKTCCIFLLVNPPLSLKNKGLVK